MDMNTKNTQLTPTTTTSETPPASTHTADATVIIQALLDMAQGIPNYSFAADENANRRLAAAATVPQAAIDMVTALVQAKPLLTGTALGPDELRDRVTFVSAYGPIPDQAEAFADGLRHTLRVVRAQVGDATLTAYEVAKRQARRADGADLRPHVADLKRLLGQRFGRNRTRQQAAPTPTLSSPSAPTSSQPNVSHGASASGATEVASQATKQQ